MVQTNTLTALAVAFLRPLVDAFLVKHAEKGWTPTRLGREACKDPGKIFLLRNGMQLRTGTALKVLAVIESTDPGFANRFVQTHAQENLHAE